VVIMAHKTANFPLWIHWILDKYVWLLIDRQCRGAKRLAGVHHSLIQISLFHLLNFLLHFFQCF
jgi:hypothetical protein